MLWDVDPQSWVEKACQRANRNLTRSEWEQYFPNEKDKYQKTCAQFSLELQQTNISMPQGNTATPSLTAALPTSTVTTPGQPSDPTIPSMRPATYLTQIRESFPCIARRYNVNPVELLMLNPFADDLIYGETVYPNSILNIPQSGNPFPGERSLRNHPTTITITSANETLVKIACQFGDVEPTHIAMANGLSLDAPLIPGQQLNIP
jgi:LysM repeat protein